MAEAYLIRVISDGQGQPGDGVLYAVGGGAMGGVRISGYLFGAGSLPAERGDVGRPAVSVAASSSALRQRGRDPNRPG